MQNLSHENRGERRRPWELFILIQGQKYPDLERHKTFFQYLKPAEFFSTLTVTLKDAPKLKKVSLRFHWILLNILINYISSFIFWILVVICKESRKKTANANGRYFFQKQHNDFLRQLSTRPHLYFWNVLAWKGKAQEIKTHFRSEKTLSSYFLWLPFKSQ